MTYTREDLIDSYFEVTLFSKRTEFAVLDIKITKEQFEELTGINIEDYQGGEYPVDAFAGEVGVYK